MPHYVKIPYPAAFYKKGMTETMRQFIAEFDDTPYSPAIITKLLSDITALKDFGRTHLKLGKQGLPVALVEQGVTLSQQQIFDKVIAAASSQQIQLTLAEVKAFFAFSVSINGESLQGGYYKLTNTPLIQFFAHLGYPIIHDGPGMNSILKLDKVAGNLLVTNNFKAGKIYNYAESAFSLILKKESFVIKEYAGLFVIELLNELDDDFLIEKDFWQNCLLPAATKLLDETNVFGSFEYFMFTPFLINPDFRKNYCQKINKLSSAMQWLAFEYIYECYHNNLPLAAGVLADNDVGRLLKDLNGKLKKSHLDLPRINHAVAAIKLNSIAAVATEVVIELQEEKPQVKEVEPEPELIPEPPTLSNYFKHLMNELRLAIDGLTVAQRKGNEELLQQVLNHAELLIQHPCAENFRKFEEDITLINSKGFKNVAMGMASILLGVVLLVATAISLVVGPVVLTTSLALVSKSILIAVGVGFVSGGFYSTLNQPLKSVAGIANRFFQEVRESAVIPAQAGSHSKYNSRLG